MGSVIDLGDGYGHKRTDWTVEQVLQAIKDQEFIPLRDGRLANASKISTVQDEEELEQRRRESDRAYKELIVRGEALKPNWLDRLLGKS